MRRLIKTLVCNVMGVTDAVVDPIKVRTLAVLSDMDRVLARTRCVVGVHDGQKMVLESSNAGALSPGNGPAATDTAASQAAHRLPQVASCQSDWLRSGWYRATGS